MILDPQGESDWLIYTARTDWKQTEILIQTRKAAGSLVRGCPLTRRPYPWGQGLKGTHNEAVSGLPGIASSHPKRNCGPNFKSYSTAFREKINYTLPVALP